MPDYLGELEQLLNAPKPAPERRGFTVREAARHLGVSEKVATKRLRSMLDDGLLSPAKEQIVNPWGDIRVANVYVPVGKPGKRR